MSPKAIVLAGVLLAAAAGGWWWYSQRHPAGWGSALDSRVVATRVLAERLKELYPGAKALVLGNPFTQRSGQSPEIYAFERASLAGLEQGFGSKEAFKVVYPELRPEFLQRPESVFVDPKTTTPLSFLVSDNSLDTLVAANPGFDLILSLIGLPVRVRDTRVWREPGKARLALVFPDWRMIGGMEAVREAFKSERIAAAVVGRPGALVDDPKAVQSDYRTEFERLFLLVTKENVDETLQTYPQLFF